MKSSLFACQTTSQPLVSLTRSEGSESSDNRWAMTRSVEPLKEVRSLGSPVTEYTLCNTVRPQKKNKNTTENTIYIPLSYTRIYTIYIITIIIIVYVFVYLYIYTRYIYIYMCIYKYIYVYVCVCMYDVCMCVCLSLSLSPLPPQQVRLYYYVYVDFEYSNMLYSVLSCLQPLKL